MKFSTAASTLACVMLGLSTSTTNAFSINSRNTLAAAVSPHHLASTFSTRMNVSTSADETSTTTANDDILNEEFLAARDQTLGLLKSKLDNEKLQELLGHFTNEYFTACQQAADQGVEGITAQSTVKNMLDALQYGMTYGLQDKFQFGSTHEALRGNPETEDGNAIDFYKFGCDFFRAAMNLSESLVLGEENLAILREQINNGENVVLLANHQSEADPQVVSCLFEKAGFNDEAEKMVYVAGHKVTTDTLAIPFSMGRNLICIHSKKHIDADPETKPAKSRENLAAMSGMLGKLRQGGTIIWVAPSGGRDRRDLDTNTVPLAPFDQKTVDMFRLMGNKSKVKTHFYALSMVSYDICPPPDFVEVGTGEQRNVRFVPVGIAVSDELENVGGVESRHLFTENAFAVCQKGYDDLLAAMH